MLTSLQSYNIKQTKPITPQGSTIYSACSGSHLPSAVPTETWVGSLGFTSTWMEPHLLFCSRRQKLLPLGVAGGVSGQASPPLGADSLAKRK